MRILIKKVTIVDPNSSFHNQVKDIFIVDGNIDKIGKNLTDEYTQIIEEENLHVSPGLFDFRATFGEPGLETKEDLTSGAKAAELGGFTGVSVTANTLPTISNRSTVEYIINKTRDFLVDVHPTGSISDKIEGKELAELYDMKLAGAVAFSDGKKAIQNPSLLSRALLYSKPFGGLIVSFANDKNINHNGQINEGIVSTNLGLESIPHLAEEIQISRDIYLAEYNSSPIHFATISSAKTVELIKKAKKDNIKVTADIAAHQIMFTDESTTAFDSNFKVLPPFRLEKDIEGLIKGLKENTISVICSDHTPVEIEDKEREFDLAKFGIINLQTAFPSMLTKLAPELGLDLIIEKMAIEPRKILKIPVPSIQENEKANIVLYNPTQKWIFRKENVVSKSKNSPYFNFEFTGKVYGVFNNSKLNIN